MKVRELIRKLRQLDPNMDVWGSMNVETRHYPAINYNPKKVVVLCAIVRSNTEGRKKNDW